MRDRRLALVDESSDRSTAVAGGTLPAMTADENSTNPRYAEAPGQAYAESPVEDTAPPMLIDMAYLYQRRMRQMQAQGRPLPTGITPEGLDQWEAEHPDYDAAKPLAGQPIPPGIEVTEQPADKLPIVKPYGGIRPVSEFQRVTNARPVDDVAPAAPLTEDPMLGQDRP